MKRDKPYLQHIYDAICDIEKFMDNTDYDSFLKNREKQYAVLRALKITGEASKNISTSLKTKYPAIPWRKIAGLRDILIHQYFGVKMERVWEVTQKDIPELKPQIIAILKAIE